MATYTRKIMVTIREVVTYAPFEIEMEFDDAEWPQDEPLEADVELNSSITEEAFEAFCQFKELPPTQSIDERDMIDWEETKPS
jgi:hypothetical protein